MLFNALKSNDPMDTALDFHSFKSDTYHDAKTKGIQIIGSQGDRLIPVGPWILRNQELVHAFCQWRNHASTNYFSQIKATVESMTTYIEKVSINERNTLLFLIEGSQGESLGHIGLRNASRKTVDIDSVMKSTQGAPPGTMLKSLQTLIDASYIQFAIEKIQLKVLSTNERAINLYRTAKFTIVQEIPLRKEQIGGSIVLSPTNRNSSNCSEKMVVMQHDPT